MATPTSRTKIWNILLFANKVLLVEVPDMKFRSFSLPCVVLAAEDPE
jgi:hypothetical protein